MAAKFDPKTSQYPTPSSDADAPASAPASQLAAAPKPEATEATDAAPGELSYDLNGAHSLADAYMAAVIVATNAAANAAALAGESEPTADTDSRSGEEIAAAEAATAATEDADDAAYAAECADAASEQEAKMDITPTPVNVIWIAPPSSQIIIPKATQFIFRTPQLYALLCTFCATMRNVVPDPKTGRILQTLCRSCRSLLNEHPMNSCTGGSERCLGRRYVDEVGAVAPLCSACDKAEKQRNRRSGVSKAVTWDLAAYVKTPYKAALLAKGATTLS
jgi:hypothetical protein